MTALDFYIDGLKAKGFSDDKIKQLTEHKDLPWLQFAEDYHAKQLILSGVSNWVTFEEDPPKEDGRYLIKQNEAVYIADYYVESDIWQDDHYNRITGVDYWKLLPE